MKFTALALVLTLVILTGCTVSQTEMQNANYGAVPSQQHVRVAKDAIFQQLKDPYSARVVKQTGPFKAFTNTLGQRKFGYAVCFLINAKNSYGAYIGPRWYFVLYNNNQPLNTGSSSNDLDRSVSEFVCVDQGGG